MTSTTSSDLAGRVALVTGGSGGIGLATVRSLVAAGAKVALSDVVAEPGRAVAAELAAHGAEVLFVPCDVSSEADVVGLVADVVRHFGRLDIAVNNAGTLGTSAPIADQPLDAWNRVVGVNFTGTFLCLREELKVMREQRSGVIVNTASNTGVHGVMNVAPYGATKFAVIGLTRSAALENGQYGIRVNAVCPGFTRTAMLDLSTGHDEAALTRFASVVPLGRIGEPDEVAQVIVWLASDASSYVSGSTIIVDGGRTA